MMKPGSLFYIIVTVLLVLSCEKEYSYEGNLARASIKDSLSGNCLPASVAGIYKQDSSLNATNYINLQVNVTKTGNYAINTNRVNGYAFTGKGTFNTVGLNAIKLYANGKPANYGLNTFNITYGSESCPVTVNVLPPAEYTLGGSGAACTGVILSGHFEAGITMMVTNTADIDVNVTRTGNYNISTTTANGVTFSSAGVFTTTGPQKITLTASGHPTAGGPVEYFVNSPIGGSCSFIIDYTGGPQAVYSFIEDPPAGGGGTPWTCASPVIKGTYTAGIALTTANSVTFNVDVSSVGTYIAVFGPLVDNGYRFSKIGRFLTTGPQQVVFDGVGIPLSVGTDEFRMSLAGSSYCSFYVTVH